MNAGRRSGTVLMLGAALAGFGEQHVHTNWPLDASLAFGDTVVGLKENAGAEFDVTVCKLGDRYVASRSRQFGCANYEIENVE